MTATALSELARFAVGGDVCAAARDKARACLLYGLSVGIAARHAPEPMIALRAQADVPVEATGATRLADGATVGTEAAAFANAVLMHARVQEDAHPAGHVGVVVVPATLACAQRLDVSGRALLAALAVGYEVALRIGRDHAGALSERGFRTTSVYGPFGAAAASARLWGMDAEQCAHALALAASAAGGLREFVQAGSQDYAFQAGFAAAGGLRCAALARAGARGAASTLDGDAGFYRAFGGLHERYGERLTAELGTAWELDRVAYKPYPVCQFHRSVVATVLDLRQAVGAEPVERIEIRMSPFEADFFGVRFAGPFSTFPQTFMSAPYCAALAWARGEVTYRGLTDYERPDVLELVARVAVIADAERARYQPCIRVQLRDGRTFERSAAGGDEAYRLDWARAADMSNRLCTEAGVPPRCAQALIDAVEALQGAPSVRSVSAAAAAACAAARP